MSNLDKIPATLGKIIQQLQPLKKATSDVWKRFTQLPQQTLFSRMSEDINSASGELQGFEKGSHVLDNLAAGQNQVTANGPGLLRRTKSAETSNQKQLTGRSLEIFQRSHIESQKQQGNDAGQQYKFRTHKIEQLKNTSSSMVAFAQPKLELAKSILQPGADLQKGLSEIQAKLGLQKSDPRLAALRQQTLSMANSGHSPADVVAEQSKLATSGLNADQILAQTPTALNGATPAAQTEVRVKGDNLDGDITKLYATWDTIRINLFEGQSAALRELTQTATGWLNTLNTWITENPLLVNSLLSLALGITGIIGGLGFLGTVIAPVLSGVNLLIAGAGLLGTVFTGAGGIMGAAFALVGAPVIALITVIAGIGLAVVKLWEPIKAFVGGVIEGFSAAMGPVSDAFSPFKAAFGWITDLFKPIKFSQDVLSDFSEVGRKVGASIAEIFVTLNKAFSQIGELLTLARKGIDWVFGWDKNDDKDASSNDASPFSNGISPTGGTLNLYQPATPHVATNLTDSRTTTQNFAFYATPDTDHKQLQTAVMEALDQQKWNETNSLLSQYDYGGRYA